ncbi:MAG: hypothetical protein PHN45_06430 [Methylococcales bacterium]|nr:hypothetical protein [Methylococcales bacterium]MDD5754371.1 hypothetical protein [Methylococcales bacterium]
MKNPPNDTPNAATQNKFNTIENLFLGLFAELTPEFRRMMLSEMAIRFGNLKAANDATFTIGLIDTESLENKNTRA